MEKNVIGSLKMGVCGEGTRSTKACMSLQTKLERSRKELVLISRFLNCQDLHGIVVELVNIRDFGM